QGRHVDAVREAHRRRQSDLVAHLSSPAASGNAAVTAIGRKAHGARAWQRRVLRRGFTTWTAGRTLGAISFKGQAMSETIPPRGPDEYRVSVDTSAGRFEIEVHRAWSPYGADRFFELARSGYYDDSRFFRTVAGKWVQFGIAGDPALAQAWR